MKLLAVIGTVDLEFRMGTTPMQWQLLKALHEVGHTVIMTSYLGKSIETPWWKVYPNPCEFESTLYNKYADRSGKRSVGHGLAKALIDRYIKPKWYRHLLNVCNKELPDAVLFTMVPLNHITGIPRFLSNRFEIPVLYFDPDLPSSLTDADSGLGSFKFDWYKGADLSEYDVYLSNSKGIVPALRDRGARRVEVLYYAADPSIFNPMPGVGQDIDVFYYGHRNIGKEEQFDYMVAEASRAMPDKIFVVGGQGHDYDIGKAITTPPLPLSEWRYWCARSKINLNITKNTDSCVYASSSARPFELAAMGCCIVSDPYEGLEEWFDSSEIWQTHSLDNVLKIYRTLLNDKPHVPRGLGLNALQRVLNQHTYQHRARQLTEIIRSL